MMKIKNKAIRLLMNSYISILKWFPIQNTIVFESEGGMNDNPRAVYDYMIAHNYHNHYRMVWIVPNVGHYKSKYRKLNTVFVSRSESSVSNQLKLQFYLSCSRFFIFSHPWWFHKRRKNQMVIDINHGVPLKGASHSFQVKDTFDFSIVPSQFAGELRMKYWHIENDKYVICGTPRNDDLFDINKSAVLKKLFVFSEQDKVIICMTTFKQSANQTDSEVIDDYGLGVVEDDIQLGCLNSFLRERNIHLIIKPHPLQLKNTRGEIRKSNIHYVNNVDLELMDIRLYNLIGCCDCLLTDYSSVFFDYLILDRPIGFLTNGMDQYTRGFIINNPEEMMPGEHIDSFKKLLLFIDDFSKGIDVFSEERKKINELINGAYKESQKNNCQSFVNWMINYGHTM